MARKSPSSGTDHLVNTSPVDPGSTGTTVFWFRPNWNSIDNNSHQLLLLCDAGANHRTIDILKYSDNNVYAGPLSVPGGVLDGRVTIADTGLFTSGTWTHICVTWNNSTPLTTLYFNGVSKGTKATTVTFASPTNLEIGNAGAESAPIPANGDFADAAYWNVILTQNEISSLAAGNRPNRIREAALLFYAPLDGIASPEPDFSGSAKNLTITGTIIAANDPPLAMFTPRWPRNIDVVSAASFIPAWAMGSNLPVLGTGLY